MAKSNSLHSIQQIVDDMNSSVAPILEVGKPTQELSAAVLEPILPLTQMLLAFTEENPSDERTYSDNRVYETAENCIDVMLKKISCTPKTQENFLRLRSLIGQLSVRDVICFLANIAAIIGTIASLSDSAEISRLKATVDELIQMFR